VMIDSGGIMGLEVRHISGTRLLAIGLVSLGVAVSYR